MGSNRPRTLGLVGFTESPKSLTNPLVCVKGFIAMGRGKAAARCAEPSPEVCSCKVSNSSCCFTAHKSVFVVAFSGQGLSHFVRWWPSVHLCARRVVVRSLSRRSAGFDFAVFTCAATLTAAGGPVAYFSLRPSLVAQLSSIGG